MKEKIISLLAKETKLPKEEVEKLIESPPSPEMGDYAFPCFVLAKQFKKNPVEIAKSIAQKIKSSDFEKVEAKGPYLNFFINRSLLADDILKKIQKEKDSYGASKVGKGKTIVFDMSSPNIAKPFGIGHLRSTIIGNSISEIAKFQGYKTVKINYLGDWGTQFGKLIVGYNKFGSAAKLKKDPIKHLLELYVKVSKDESLEESAREEFKKLEDSDKENLKLWKQFRDLSLKEFDKIYNLLDIKFDLVSGESTYNNKMDKTIEELEKKNLLKESEGAQIVDLESYNLGVCLIKKSDGATLYATRDLTAAIDRHNKYKFDKMIYEVGSEQKLHFRQIFKVLELLGYKWAKDCVHVDHGLYLGEDGKKFSTRKGKTVFMSDILEETRELAKAELKKRYKLSEKELELRTKAIANAAIFYGDLKNYRANDVIFDIDRFLSFEGDTGPYLLYTYARAKSILEKAKYSSKNKYSTIYPNDKEKALIFQLGNFPQTVSHALKELSPNIIANYTYQLAQQFNEFYHSTQVIGSDNEAFRLALVDSFSQVLKNALALLGISVIEKM